MTTRRDTRRITIIARNAESSPRAWNMTPNAHSHVILVNSLSMLTGAMQHGSEDVERLILDGTATPTQFLELLATLPQSFMGDVILRTISGSFLSASGRAEGRLLYAMTTGDLQFYLETNDLVTAIRKAA
jgi:hypothetical protein